MENTITDVATGIQELRECILQEGTVTSTNDTITTKLEAKKKHLDQLAAKWRARSIISRHYQADDIFSPADKDRMEKEIIEGLKKKLMLEDLI